MPAVSPESAYSIEASRVRPPFMRVRPSKVWFDVARPAGATWSEAGTGRRGRRVASVPGRRGGGGGAGAGAGGAGGGRRGFAAGVNRRAPPPGRPGPRGPRGAPLPGEADPVD